MNYGTGTLIARWRERLGWSQKDLAERLGLKPQAISQWELGKTSPTAARLEEVARAFGVTMAEFYAAGDTGDPEVSG